MMNMRLITAVAMLVSLNQIGVVFALGNSDNGPGCGLGKLAWSDYGGQKQIAPQVMMATTNGTFGSTTFGISSGTSGCTNDGVIMKNKHINMAQGSFENLKQEMAQGQGEHLASLATLLGVPTENQPEFFSLLQEKYVSLVQSEETTPLIMLQAIQEAMSSHPVLAKVAHVD